MEVFTSCLTTSAESRVQSSGRIRWSSRIFSLAAACLALILSASSIALAQEFKSGDIQINDPWSRAVPPGAPVAAGYMTIRNVGSEPDRLIAAETEIAGKSELHQMLLSDEGVMRMRPMPQGLEIPAGGTVELAPGSYHLMISDLTGSPTKDKSFMGTLVFERAGKVEVTYEVRPVGASRLSPEDQVDNPDDGN